MGILNFFRGERPNERAEAINQGIEAENRTSLAGAEDSAESGVDMTNAIEIETDEDRSNIGEREQRIVQGLKAIVDQYGVKPGELQGKEDFFRKMLATKLFLTEHEARLESTKPIVAEAIASLAKESAEGEYDAKTARQTTGTSAEAWSSQQDRKTG